jgi:hypothetical protein
VRLVGLGRLNKGIIGSTMSAPRHGIAVPPLLLASEGRRRVALDHGGVQQVPPPVDPTASLDDMALQDSNCDLSSSPYTTFPSIAPLHCACATARRAVFTIGRRYVDGEDNIKM